MESDKACLLSSSKKIKKAQRPKKTQQRKPSSSSSSSPSETDEKKYQTFDAPIRTKILCELKKGIIDLSNLDSSQENFGINDILNLIKELKLPSYNKLIVEIFSSFDPNLDFSPKALIQWRKKIVNWFKSSENPETRGGVVISGQISPIFIQEVIKILNGMHIRCFPTLRGKILPLLVNLKCQVEVDGKPLDENTCSKHWWFNFLKKNLEIKKIWTDIPLERTYNKRLSKGLIVEKSQTESTKLSVPFSTLASPNLEKQMFKCEVDNFINYEESRPNYQISESSKLSARIVSLSSPTIEQMFDCDADNFIMYEKKQTSYQISEILFDEKDNCLSYNNTPRTQIEAESELSLEGNEQVSQNINEDVFTLIQNRVWNQFNSSFCPSPIIENDLMWVKGSDQADLFNFNFN